MNFEETLISLKRGRICKRKNWTREYLFAIWKHRTDYIYKLKNKKFSQYTPNWEDITADNWEELQ